MATAKDIVLAPVTRKQADAIIEKYHYSGLTVNNSQLNIGVYMGGKLEGALQFGPSLDKRKIIGLVAGSEWNEFIELNRMALSDNLPRNSESRALSISMKLIKKYAPHIKWVVSFADGQQCGDGTIYRAAGFLLTGYSSGQMWELPETLIPYNNGFKAAHRVKIQGKYNPLSRKVLEMTNGKNLTTENCVARFGGRVLEGYIFRYICFIDKTWQAHLTVPVLPYSLIGDLNGRIYKGVRYAAEVNEVTTNNPLEEGGASPTQPLCNLEVNPHE